MKIRPVEAELFHVDRQKDRDDEANSLFFCNFVKANKKPIMPKNGFHREEYR